MFLTRRRHRQFEDAEGTGPIPVVTSVNRPIRYIYGTDFGQKIGKAKLEVYVEGEWSERGTMNWFDTWIQHDLPTLPAGSKVRVTNAYGNVSNEFEVT